MGSSRRRSSSPNKEAPRRRSSSPTKLPSPRATEDTMPSSPAQQSPAKVSESSSPRATKESMPPSSPAQKSPNESPRISQNAQPEETATSPRISPLLLESIPRISPESIQPDNANAHNEIPEKIL